VQVDDSLALVLEEEEQQQVLAQVAGEQEIRSHVLAAILPEPPGVVR
jgi:hypothetical protein